MYCLYEIGQNVRIIHQTTVIRKDVQVVNDRGETLECTYFLPDNMIKEKKLPIIIYLHGNSGSRVESVSTLQHLIPTFGLFCFDFSGSGKSQGKYVTMGLNECRDLESVVKYVEENLTQNQIIIWGRSMGAVTGILYASKYQQKIAGLILDSPFSDLKKVMQEIASSKTKIPSLIVDGAISLVKSKIQETLNGVDIFNTQIEEKIKCINIPILFAYGTKDTIILPYHSQTLYKACKSDDKSIIEFEGNHNTIRPNHFYHKIIAFINQNCLRGTLIKQLNTPHHIQRNNEKNASDITRIVRQQQDISPANRIISHNINNNNFYDNKPQKHLQSLPSEERQIHKVDEKQFQTNPHQYTSPQLHQNFREKDRLQQQQQQLQQQQQRQQQQQYQKQQQNQKPQQDLNHNNHQQDLTPKGIQLRQNIPGPGHVKSQSMSGQPQQSRGISLVSYQQKETPASSPFQLSYNNVNSKSDSKSQLQKVANKQNQFESIFPNQQHAKPPQDNRKNSEAKPARKKIFQDTFSERKQVRNASNQGIPPQQQQQGIQGNQQTFYNQQPHQQGQVIMDSTDQYISNQINLFEDFANQSNKNSKSPMSKQPQNSTSIQASSNPFAKSPSISAISPTAKLNFANQDSQNHINSRGIVGQSIGSSQIKISPFLVESQNIAQTPHNNNARQNNFIERQITPTQQLQNQGEKVKKSSNYVSSRQYSLDGGNMNNNSNTNINGKDLTDYYQFGIQCHRKNESMKCISPSNNIQQQINQQNNSMNEQFLQQQYASVDRNAKQCSQPSQQKFESFTEYQNQLIPNPGSGFDWNNSSFDPMSQSYLNPTKNPFSMNNLQQPQQQQPKQINIMNNNSIGNDSKLQVLSFTPQGQSNYIQQHQFQAQKQLFLSDNTADCTPQNNATKNTNYVMQSINQQYITDKQQIIENQLNALREAEQQERQLKQNPRSRNLSAANAGNVVITRSNNQENSVPRQQIIQEKQNVIVALPGQAISFVPQQQVLQQNNGNKFNLVLQSNNNNQSLRERQTLSPVNRNLISTPLPPAVNVISYNSHQQQGIQKTMNQNILQPVIQQQYHAHPPLSPFPIVHNSAQQNVNNENISRRFSGIENNNDKVQFVSVFTQQLQNRTQREKDFTQQSQRSQFKYSDKRYPQGNEGRIIKQSQQPSLFQKVLTEIQNQNQNQEDQTMYSPHQQQDLKVYVNNNQNSRLHYESVSMAEQMVPVYESNENKKPAHHFDSHLPVSHQITNQYPKQIELHTNFSNEEQPVIYSID